MSLPKAWIRIVRDAYNVRVVVLVKVFSFCSLISLSLFSQGSLSTLIDEGGEILIAKDREPNQTNCLKKDADSVHFFFCLAFCFAGRHL